MRRLACVDVHALPLQLLLRRAPQWRGQAVAVVDSDRPQGKVLWLSEEARAARIVPGMRYAAALSLSSRLHAAVVSAGEITSAVGGITERLRGFTPDVEADSEQPGVFWLNASGLGRLFDSPARWAGLIRSRLADDSLAASVVVGFSRFAVFAVARAASDGVAVSAGARAAAGGVVVFHDPDNEREAARRVPLAKLPFPPRSLEVLHKLGVRTVGELSSLPPEGIGKRLGQETWRLYREARGDIEIPLDPSPAQLPLERTVHLDHDEKDLDRLMTMIAELLADLLADLTARGLAAAEVRVLLVCGRRAQHRESLRPAAPTTELRQLVELLHLRLGSISLPDAVTDITLGVEALRIRSVQLEIFAAKPRRDLAAAGRALARLRAELGDAAVVHARLRDGHLPEASFAWEPLRILPAAAPQPTQAPILVRRFYRRAILLPPRPRHEPDGWMLRNLEDGPVMRVLGPYIVSGGWWRTPVHREYHFAETQRGEILWVYYDRVRRRWFIQGRVE